MATKWGARDDKRLRLFYEAWSGEVVPVEQIAAALKFSPAAVRARAKKLDLVTQSVPKDQKSASKAKRSCAHCGTEFVLRTPSSVQQTCSRSCAAKKRTQSTRGRFTGGRSRVGKRETLGGLFVRSSWEHNFCLILMDRVKRGEIASWEYEPQKFSFPVKRGNKAYVPDFKVWYPDGSYRWVEIKGYMDSDSRIKLTRFALHFPEESMKLDLIEKPAYMALKAEFEHKLVGWE